MTFSRGSGRPASTYPGKSVGQSLKSVGAITCSPRGRARAKAFYERVFDVSILNVDDASIAFKFDNLIVNLLDPAAAPELDFEPAVGLPTGLWRAARDALPRPRSGSTRRSSAIVSRRSGLVSQRHAEVHWPEPTATSAHSRSCTASRDPRRRLRTAPAARSRATPLERAAPTRARRTPPRRSWARPSPTHRRRAPAARPRRSPPGGRPPSCNEGRTAAAA